MSQAGFEMVRYADDFVILCRTADEAARALERVQAWTAANGLTLHPSKTRLVDARSEGFEFLGYHFCGEQHWPRTKSLNKLKDTLRAKTRRRSGNSLQRIVAQVNPILRGWFAYFQHGTRRTLYKDLDGWLRMRLRSLLRRRQNGRGVARNQRASFTWPNRFFAEHGLFSLQAAHVLACQSSRR
jgi:RNA-directed DNA polymerase